ncbi:MAG: glycosyltransferase family 2 protein [Deltaproteobacteria bacterium]
MTERKPLAVFIIHWNRPEECAASAQKFLAQTVPVRITVIDNGSSPENLAALREGVCGFAQVMPLAENLGFGPGLNEGLNLWLADEDGGDFVVLSAHDAAADGDCLEILIKAMRENPRVGIAGAEFGVGYAASFSAFRGPVIEFGEKGEGFERHAFANGTVMIFRRACISEIGIFDDIFFAYGDEVDLCLRAAAAGWMTGVVWGARARNPGCSAPSAMVSYLQVRNAILLVRRWKGRGFAAARTALFALNALRGIVWKSKKPAMFSARAWAFAIRDAWLGRYGAPPESLRRK